MGVLPLESVIGFDGKVTGGLVLHPDGRTLIYPLGATVVVKELGDTFAQTFLQGHTDEVSCLTVSPDGRYLASGQLSFMGFSADIIVWDMETRKAVHRMSLHKVKVQDLAFSPCGTYLASLGGQDDNSLVIWDVHSGNAICGTPVPGLTKCLSYFNVDSYKLATGGGQSLVVWDFDKPNRKLRPHKVNMGSLRRNAEYITVDDNVSFAPSPHPQFFQFWVPAHPKTKRSRQISNLHPNHRFIPTPADLPSFPTFPRRHSNRTSRCSSARPPATCSRSPSARACTGRAAHTSRWFPKVSPPTQSPPPATSSWAAATGASACWTARA